MSSNKWMSLFPGPITSGPKIFTAFSNEVDADVYVYVHATAPFISQETIKQCVEAVRSGEYDSAFCATKIQDFLWKDGEPLNFDAANSEFIAVDTHIQAPAGLEGWKVITNDPYNPF